MTFPFVIEYWLRGRQESEYKISAPNEIVALAEAFKNENTADFDALSEVGAEIRIYRADVDRVL